MLPIQAPSIAQQIAGLPSSMTRLSTVPEIIAQVSVCRAYSSERRNAEGMRTLRWTWWRAGREAGTVRRADRARGGEQQQGMPDRRRAPCDRDTLAVWVEGPQPRGRDGALSSEARKLRLWLWPQDPLIDVKQPAGNCTR